MPKHRTPRSPAWLLLAVVVVGCQTDDVVVPDDEVFTAVLTGDAEVPPRDTPASGSASFEFDGTTVAWTLTVGDIDNAVAAHIHGPAGTDENAGVIVTLVPSGPFTGTRSGSFTQVDATSSLTFDALLELMRDGRTYVNVHTNDGADPPNTGPGDFPGGEIRGQIERQ